LIDALRVDWNLAVDEDRVMQLLTLLFHLPSGYTPKDYEKWIVHEQGESALYMVK